jgi:hypothetical protein
MRDCNGVWHRYNPAAASADGREHLVDGRRKRTLGEPFPTRNANDAGLPQPPFQIGDRAVEPVLRTGDGMDHTILVGAMRQRRIL